MDNSGTFTKPTLCVIKPILETWIQKLSNFQPHENITFPYWYNERANISILASVATINDWQVLEEFHQQKVGYNGNDSKGRLDLWIYKNSESFFIEAKQDWPSLSNRIYPNAISWSMDHSIEDTKRLKTKNHRWLAISFLVPRIIPSRLNQLNSRIDQLLKMAKDHNHDFYAWSFLDRNLSAKDDKYIYPGILLVGHEIGHDA